MFHKHRINWRGLIFNQCACKFIGMKPMVDNKSTPSTKVFGGKLNGRSRITNGSSLLPSIDGRSIWARRLRDLISLHENDYGGADAISEAERSLIRRAAALTVEL